MSHKGRRYSSTIVQYTNNRISTLKIDTNLKLIDKLRHVLHTLRDKMFDFDANICKSYIIRIDITRRKPASR